MSETADVFRCCRGVYYNVFENGRITVLYQEDV
jgi:hypothetical protein